MMTTLLPTTSFAKTGDIIGYAKYTDISAYVNHYPITSYNINDYTAVVAEDLQNYGFNVVWNGDERSLSISRNDSATAITPYGTIYKYSAKAGQNSFPYLETDIKTYVNGHKVDSFNIDGKTCVYIDALAPYGEVVWIPETRAIKFWLEGLPIKEYSPIKEDPASFLPDNVSFYPGTNIPTFDSYTGEKFSSSDGTFYWYSLKNYDSFNSYSEMLKNIGWEKSPHADREHREKLGKDGIKRTVPYKSCYYFSKGDEHLSFTIYFQSSRVCIAP